MLIIEIWLSVHNSFEKWFLNAVLIRYFEISINNCYFPYFLNFCPERLGLSLLKLKKPC